MPNAVEAEQLVEAYLPLALSIANRWGERWPWLRDDFRSEAAYALWRAATVYTQDKPFAFATAVHVATRRACWNRLRRERRTAPEAFRAPPSADPDLDLLKLLADHSPEAADRIDAAEEVEKLLAVLTPTQAAAVTERFLAERTVAEIADANGTSREAVREGIDRGLNRMRVAMSKGEGIKEPLSGCEQL